MQVNPQRFAENLDKGLAPVYLLCGEEPLQKEESADLIRQACRRLGVSGREVFYIDSANFDWGRVSGHRVYRR